MCCFPVLLTLVFKANGSKNLKCSYSMNCLSDNIVLIFHFRNKHLVGAYTVLHLHWGYRDNRETALSSKVDIAP